jgi:hypothetical protein
MRKTDEQFIVAYRLAVENGQDRMGIATQLGMTTQGVEQRRESIEKKMGIRLPRPTRKKRVDKRRDSTVKEMVKRLGKSTRH